MKALFLSDDKEDWDLIRSIFNAHFSFIKLIHVTKASEALNSIMIDGPIDIVLIDCEVEDDGPAMLAHNIFDNSGRRPIIFIGSELMLKEQVDGDFYAAHEMTYLHKKPYNAPKLKKTIQESIEWIKKEEFANSIVDIQKEDFIPMKLRNFYLFDSLPYDIYIELTSTKYIKAIAADCPYTQSTIQDFRRRNIRYLHLQKNEHLNFLERSMARIESTIKKRDAPLKVTLQTQVAAALVIQQYLRNIGISEGIISFTEKLIESLTKTYGSVFDFYEILSKFPFESGDLAEQAILKAYFCEGLAHKMDWRSMMARRKLLLSALIHDCFISDESLTKIFHLDHPDLKQLDSETQEEFKNHPKKAAAIARHYTSFPDVDFIIEQHQELPDGSGFPRRLNSNSLTNLSCLFILASNFVSQLNIYGLNKMAISNILASMNAQYSQGNFKDSFKHLKKILKGH